MLQTQYAQIETSSREISIKLQRVFISGNGVIRSSGMLKSEAEMVPGLGGFRQELSCDLEFLDGSVILAVACKLVSVDQSFGARRLAASQKHQGGHERKSGCLEIFNCLH